MTLTQNRLKELLTYDPATGVFRWSETPRKGVRAGHVAGNITRDGKGVRIRIDRISYKAHRLAWLYVHGDWPSGEIDHAKGTPYDNRFTNLRDASHTQNMGNAKRRQDNSSGFKGVARSAAKQERWRAHLRGKYLGSFDTREDAHAAYAEAAGDFYGEFARLS